jgi:hypothetical protein
VLLVASVLLLAPELLVVICPAPWVPVYASQNSTVA